MNHFPLILNTLPLYGPEYVHINSGFTTIINGIIIEIICHNKWENRVISPLSWLVCIGQKRTISMAGSIGYYSGFWTKQPFHAERYELMGYGTNNVGNRRTWLSQNGRTFQLGVSVQLTVCRYTICQNSGSNQFGGWCSLLVNCHSVDLLGANLYCGINLAGLGIHRNVV